MDDRHEGYGSETSGGAPGVELAGASIPALPARLLSVFLSPGKLTEQLAAEPRWIGALLASTAVIVVGVTLIPVEVFLEANRQVAIERGVELPEMGERGQRFLRIVIPVGSAVGSVAFSFLFASIYTVIFAFVLGDEGRFRQYLAVLSHAYFIPALCGLLVTPLRISTGDPQFTLNLASFFAFLPDGYLLNVLRVFDLTQIWSLLVIAQGAHAIDRRRSFTSAAAIVLSLFTAVALVVARFMSLT